MTLLSADKENMNRTRWKINKHQKSYPLLLTLLLRTLSSGYIHCFSFTTLELSFTLETTRNKRQEPPAFSPRSPSLRNVQRVLYHLQVRACSARPRAAVWRTRLLCSFQANSLPSNLSRLHGLRVYGPALLEREPALLKHGPAGSLLRGRLFVRTQP